MAHTFQPILVLFSMPEYGAKKYKSSHFHLNQTGRRLLCGAPVNDAAPCSQVLSLQQPPVQGEVLHEGRLAVRRSVYVPVVTNRQQRLEGVLHHAGHRDGNQTVRLVVFKDVTPLAMQEEHNRLQENRKMHMGQNIPLWFFFYSFSLSEFSHFLSMEIHSLEHLHPQITLVLA